MKVCCSSVLSESHRGYGQIIHIVILELSTWVIGGKLVEGMNILGIVIFAIVFGECYSEITFPTFVLFLLITAK